MKRAVKTLLLLCAGVFLLINRSSSFSQGLQTWTNLGLYGGQIYDIAIDPIHPDKMFVGSYMGDGLFVTMDGGSTWRAVEASNDPPGEATFKNHAVWAVKIAPSDHNVIWVAHNDWVEKSEDGGYTWTHIYNLDMQGNCSGCGGAGDASRFCRSLAIDPLNAQTVYVGTGGPSESSLSGAIYKTQDGGRTWQKTGFTAKNEFDYGVVHVDINPQLSNVIWAVTDSSGYGTCSGGWCGTLYRSLDGGASWKVAFDLGQYGAAYLTVAAKPGDPNTAFTGSGFGIIKHYFDGTQWHFSWPIISDSRLVQDICYDPQNPQVMYAAWLNPYFGDFLPKVARSTDGGVNWEIYTVNQEFLTLAVHPANGEVIFGGEVFSGAFKSQDHGQSWSPINNGINAVIVYDVAIDPNDSTHLLAGTLSGLYEKKASGAWKALLSTDTRSVHFDPTDSLTFYAGNEGRLARTTDGGATWGFSNWLNASGNTYNYVNDIGVDANNPSTIFVAVNGFGDYGEIYKSVDGGTTFSKVLDGQNLPGVKYPFNTVAVDPSDSNHVLGGGGSFFSPKVLGDLWESKDGGSNWIRTSLQNEIVNALLIDPQNPKVMYAGCGFSGGTDVPLYKSTDGGVSWTRSYEGIPTTSTPFNAVTDLQFHRKNTNVVYASTFEAGVYVSPNQGGKWLNLGTPEYDVFAIATSSLYGATQGGLYQCTGTGVIAGALRDADSNSGIDGATVYTDLGLKTTSVQGEYMMVHPCGIFTVTAVADGHANMTLPNVTVLGGDVNWADMSMPKGVAGAVPGEGGSGGGGGGGCFIAASTDRSWAASKFMTPEKFLGIALWRACAESSLPYETDCLPSRVGILSVVAIVVLSLCMVGSRSRRRRKGDSSKTVTTGN